MRVINEELVYDKKEWCCGCSVVGDNIFRMSTFICGDWFGKEKRVICDKCFKRLIDGDC